MGTVELKPLIFNIHGKQLTISNKHYMYNNKYPCMELIRAQPPSTLGMNFMRSLHIGWDIDKHQLGWTNLF